MKQTVGRKRQQTSRKDEVLRVAARLFRAHGYHGTSMQELAAALGLEKGSLYHHLTSKEELVFEIMTAGLALATSKLDEILANPSLCPIDKLRAVIRSLIEDITEDFDDSVALSVISDGRILSPRLRAKYIRARDAYESKLKSILVAAVAAGEIAPCNTSLVAKAVVAICAWMVLWYRPDGPLKPPEIAEVYADLLIRGLAPGLRLAASAAGGDRKAV